MKTSVVNSTCVETGVESKEVIFHYTAEEVRSGHARRPYMMSAANIGRLVREIAKQLEDKGGVRSLQLAKALLFTISSCWNNTLDKKTLNFPFALKKEDSDETQDFNCLIMCKPVDQEQVRKSPLIAESFARSARPVSLLQPETIQRQPDGSETHSFISRALPKGSVLLNMDNEYLGSIVLTHLHGTNGDSLVEGRVPTSLSHGLGKVFLDNSGKIGMVNIKIEEPFFVALLGGVWTILPMTASQQAVIDSENRTTQRKRFSDSAPNDGGWPKP